MTKGTEIGPARAIRVKKVRTSALQPNPWNPRMLFDKDPLQTLEDSIKRVGILVPLTVYRQKSDEQLVILDGQRRWLCAQKLSLSTVPVNVVAEPSTVQNIVTMFQIHKLRADWELMPTALKLAILMKELKEKSDTKLAVLTGLDEAVVRRCKKLLSYEKKFQNLMLEPEPSKRIKADFFIELYPVLHDRVISKMDGFSKSALTSKMLAKYKHGAIKAVTDFRKVKQHIANARKANKIPTLIRRFKEFTDRVELDTDHLIIPAAYVSAHKRKINREVQKLKQTFEDLDVDLYIGEEDLWLEIEALYTAIRACLNRADRRIKE